MLVRLSIKLFNVPWSASISDIVKFLIVSLEFMFSGTPPPSCSETALKSFIFCFTSRITLLISVSPSDLASSTGNSESTPTISNNFFKSNVLVLVSNF